MIGAVTQGRRYLCEQLADWAVLWKSLRSQAEQCQQCDLSGLIARREYPRLVVQGVQSVLY